MIVRNLKCLQGIRNYTLLWQPSFCQLSVFHCSINYVQLVIKPTQPELHLFLVVLGWGVAKICLKEKHTKWDWVQGNLANPSTLSPFISNVLGQCSQYLQYQQLQDLKWKGHSVNKWPMNINVWETKTDAKSVFYTGSVRVVFLNFLPCTGKVRNCNGISIDRHSKWVNHQFTL